MKALVVGGTGFIGTHIVNHLISEGIRVRVMIRNKGRSNLDSLEGVETVSGDVTDLESLKAAAGGVDYVFSAFGILGRWAVPEKRYREINTEGVRNLLLSCRDRGVKQLFHISSAGVLGPLPKATVADESFPLAPSNAYERSKGAAEEVVRECGRKYGIPFTIIRPEFVYGPEDTHVLGLFKAIRDKRFYILGDGKSVLHPTFINDLIRGIALCIGNPEAVDQIFLITGERPVSVRELAEIIAAELDVGLPGIRIPKSFSLAVAGVLEIGGRILNFEPVITRARVRFFTENRAFSSHKAESLLGYSPETGVEDGVRRTVRWYRKNGYL